MVLKFVIIGAALVISSIIIGGAIVAAQAIANDFGERGPRPRESAQDSKGQQSLPPAINGTRVDIVDNAESNSYSPNPIKVKVGETVTWVNVDSATHTATSNDGTFDSHPMRHGEAFSFAFDKKGQYQYSCAIHPHMEGTVVVTAA